MPRKLDILSLLIRKEIKRAYLLEHFAVSQNLSAELEGSTNGKDALLFGVKAAKQLVFNETPVCLECPLGMRFQEKSSDATWYFPSQGCVKGAEMRTVKKSVIQGM